MQALDTKSEIKRRLLYELRCSPLKKRQESLSHKGVKLALVNKKILPLKLLRNRDEDLLLAERTINEKK